MIIGEIKRHLRDNSTIRVSRTLKDIAYKALKVRQISNNDEITNKEIAEIIGVTEKALSEAIEAVCEPYSLYDTFKPDNGDEFELIDQIKNNKDNDENWLEKIALNMAIDGLGEKEKEIISLRYYKGKTQVQVARQIGISQAQVSRIEKNALERIKKHL